MFCICLFSSMRSILLVLNTESLMWAFRCIREHLERLFVCLNSELCVGCSASSNEISGLNEFVLSYYNDHVALS